MLFSVGKDGDKVNFKETEVDSIGELAAYIVNKPYSLGTFKNNYRNVANFIQTKAIGLDFDEGMTIDEAVDAFSEYMHIIAPSRNHRKEKNGVIADRFRVILFLTTPITDVETFYSTWFSVTKDFPTVDRACKDPSRFWYPSQEIVSINEKGKRIEPVEPQPKSERKKVELSEGDKGKLSNRALRFLVNSAPVGKRHEEIYFAARDAHQNGYTEEWFLDQLYALSDKVEDPDLVDDGALKTVHDAFTKEPKHDPRIEQKAFKMVRIGELYKDKTKVEWLVGDLLTVGGVSLISADPKAGKSTLVRQLIRDVLRGDFFLQRKCRQGKVFYFAIEEQIQVINTSFKRLGVNDSDDLFVHVGDPLSDNTLKDFRDLLLEQRPALAVIDTLFDFLEVESENNYREVKRELRRLRQVARESGTHIMLVHHSSKAQKDDKRRGNRSILGSQAIAGGVDTIMVIEVDGPERLITTSGREISPWRYRQLVFNDKDNTYSLGTDNRDEF